MRFINKKDSNQILYLDNIDMIRIINIKKAFICFILILLYFYSVSENEIFDENSNKFNNLDLLYNFFKEKSNLCNFIILIFSLTLDSIFIFIMIYWIRKENSNFEIIFSFLLFYSIGFITNYFNSYLINETNYNNKESLFKILYPSILISTSRNNCFSIQIGVLNLLKNYFYEFFYNQEYYYDEDNLEVNNNNKWKYGYIFNIFIILFSIFLIIIKESLGIAILFGYMTSELIYLKNHF